MNIQAGMLIVIRNLYGSRIIPVNIDGTTHGNQGVLMDVPKFLSSIFLVVRVAENKETLDFIWKEKIYRLFLMPNNLNDIEPAQPETRCLS